MAAVLAIMLGGVLAFSSASPASAVLAGGSISGFVYQDTNNNGVKDAGEPGISGVTVTLSGDEDAVTTTDANGSYTFVLNLSNEGCEYTVTETQPAGFADGIDTVGNWGGTLGNDTISLCIDADDVAFGYNFGELPLETPTAQRKLKTHTPTATPTAPPSTATPTPALATSTPQPSATKPGAGAGGVVRAPDTGLGGSGGRDTTTTGIVFAALALLVAGGAVAGRGVWQRTRRQR